MLKFALRTWLFDQALPEIVTGLTNGQHRHNMLELGIRAIEETPLCDAVGFNGAPNLLGQMELDALFIDGNTRNMGAVASVSNYLPVRIARKLMESGLHVALSGAGAEMFAKQAGLPTDLTLSDTQRLKWEKEVQPLLLAHGDKPLIDLVREMARPRDENLDTIIMMASDGQGLSGAASTSGWSYKHPSRAGDTPVPGAGLYVDSRFGACACTHTGEMAIRCGTARYVVTQLEAGKSVAEALDMAMADISHLQGGVRRALVIHAIDANGVADAVAINADHDVFYHYWHENMAGFEKRQARPIELAYRA